MPITSTASKKIYITDDSTTEFPFPYRFFATSDLVVTEYTIADGTESVLVEDTDYTVTGSDDGEGGYTDYTSGGTVTLTEAAGDGYKLIIQRTLPITQEFDFAPNSDFSEDSFEEELDRMVAILQQQQSILDRCIKMDASYSSVSSVFDQEDVTVNVEDFVISEFSAKTTVHANDLFVIADSENSNVHKTVLQSKIININNETEKTALHADDLIYIEDSQASFVKKKVKSKNVLIINTLTEKTAVVEDDLILIEDSGGSNAKKKIKAKNVIIVNTLTEKTSIVDDDLILIEDSEDNNDKKKIKKSNFGLNLRKVGSDTVTAGTTLQVTGLSGSTNYRVVFNTIGNNAAGTHTIKITFNEAGGTAYQYVYEYHATDTDTGNADEVNQAGIQVSAANATDTHGSGSFDVLFYHGDATRVSVVGKFSYHDAGADAFAMSDFWGHFDGNAIASIEIVASRNINGAMAVYKYE